MWTPTNTQDKFLREVIALQRKSFAKYHTTGNEIAQKIYEAVSQTDVSINRPFIGGSIGKGTWLGVSEKPDFDVVFLLNKSPAEAIASSRKIMATIGRAVQGLPHPFKYVKQGSRVVKCCHGDFEFDIVPGLNFVRNTATDPHHALTNLERTLQYIDTELKGDIKKPFISASLGEYTVKFVKEQDEFVHDVIMLGKLWYNKQVKPSKKGESHGRSYTMELVAIHAATKETNANGGQRKLFGAFLRFLQVFQLPRNQVKIFFGLNVNPTLRGVNMQYQKMIAHPGVILDPTNPWNNLMDQFTPEQWENIRRVAGYCFEVIQHSESESVIKGRFQ